MTHNILSSAPAVATDFLIALLDGAESANAIMPWGAPGPIRLPDDPTGRVALIRAHLGGAPADVMYAPGGQTPERRRVPAVALAAFCPAADGLVRWIGFDCDAADGHGERGLADPIRAAGGIAERAHAAGLGAGAVVARSRGGKGRHVWLMPPEPVALADAALVAGALAAHAWRVAGQDVADSAGELSHAFARPDGTIARPGDSGAVELLPHSTQRPERGWSLALPLAGAYRIHGGGRIVDPFAEDDREIELTSVPRADAGQWRRFVEESRRALARRTAGRRAKQNDIFHRRVWPRRDPMQRLDARTREFIDGGTPAGGRNRAAFIAYRNLIGCGVSADDAARLVVQGAAGCGLPEREARSVIRSAQRRAGVRR